MCFGVRDAIALAERSAQEEPVTVLGQLVHNASVLERLKRRGVRFAESPGEVKTRSALITAHGASDMAVGRARAAGLDLIDTTCPLVRVAHNAVRSLVEQGFHPVIIGKRGHVEVNGLTEDLEAVEIVLTKEEIDRIESRARFGVAAQTTQPIERVRALVGYLRERFPASEVRFADTVCQPTKQRQGAAVELAKTCDVVLVIGGANSNNTRELVETSRKHCSRVHHLWTAADLRAEWFESTDTVGLTAGTSTPDRLIDEVETALKAIADRLVDRIHGVGAA